MSYDVMIISVIAGLMVVPRLLLRLGIPAPLTALAMGLFPMLFGYQLLGSESWTLLATLGITSLFLYSGIEVDVDVLFRERARLITHLSIKLAMIFCVTRVLLYFFKIDYSLAILLTLAIVTPSTGFVINTLGRLRLSEAENLWVNHKAIAGEVVALFVMFVALQASNPQLASVDVVFNTLALIGLILALPVILAFIGKVIIPWAPGSEFSLLIVMGIVAGYATNSLGVYELVGAFLVGLVVTLLKGKIPAMASEKNLDAIRLFATFFIPFYFFVAGTKFPEEALTVDAIVLGTLLLVIVTPIRWLLVWFERRLTHDESQFSSLKVSIALTPTLLFTLVISEVLLDRGGITSVVYGALVTYAVLNTVLPTLLFAGFKLKDHTGGTQ